MFLLKSPTCRFDIDYEAETTGSILVCSENNDFGIISDVDDTIIKSQAMNLMKKMRIMLTKNAETRVAFDKVDELYRKLSANEKNPLFFVSGSSFNLYDMLAGFCNYHNIPKAPFFLRDLGLDVSQWVKQDTSEYKKRYIGEIMDFYANLPFILIGDSGQQDPEIYTDIYNENPTRVKAIYIRHLQSEKRKNELEKMAEKTDIPFLIMENSEEAIKHATQMRWIV